MRCNKEAGEGEEEVEVGSNRNDQQGVEGVESHLLILYNLYHLNFFYQLLLSLLLSCLFHFTSFFFKTLTIIYKKLNT